MNTRELLEKDKEQLKTRLSTASTAEEAAEICDSTVNRILLRYNEQAPSDAVRKAAAASLATVRSALPLINSTGEVRTYERTLPAVTDRASGWVPLAAGAGLSAASAFVLTAAPAALSVLGFILLAGGLVSVFAGGLKFGKKRGAAPQKEQIIEVHPDSDKIYRNLSGLLTVVDRQLEDTQYEETQAGGVSEQVTNSRSPVPADELQLFSGILESAYAKPDDPESQSVISNIRFYLHKKGIEAVDYSEETARYFNKMPSRTTCTLRPALLQDNTVLSKGLAGSGE